MPLHLISVPISMEVLPIKEYHIAGPLDSMDVPVPTLKVWFVAMPTINQKGSPFLKCYDPPKQSSGLGQIH